MRRNKTKTNYHKINQMMMTYKANPKIIPPLPEMIPNLLNKLLDLPFKTKLSAHPLCFLTTKIYILKSGKELEIEMTATKALLQTLLKMEFADFV